MRTVFLRRRRGLWGLLAAAALVATTLPAMSSVADTPPPAHGAVTLTGVCSALNPDGRFNNVTVNASFTGLPPSVTPGDNIILEIDSISGDQSTGTVSAAAAASGTGPTVTYLNANMPATISADPPLGPFDEDLSYTVTLIDDTTGGTLIDTDVASVVLPHNDHCTDIGGIAPVTPTRILDTRSGLGAPRAAVPAGGEVKLQVLGRGGVPSGGVSAVALNVTVTQPTGIGYVVVWPSHPNDPAAKRPLASNIDFNAGQTVPNMVMAKVGSDGKVALDVVGGGKVQLIADVFGYVVAGGDQPPVTPTELNTFIPTSPYRVLDTRNGTGANPGAVHGGGSVLLRVNNAQSPVPGNANGVVLNVTVTGGTGLGYVTVYSGTGSQPVVSNLDFGKGQTVENLVVTATTKSNNSTDAFVTLAVGGAASMSVHLIADVMGYYVGTGNANNPNGTFRPIAAEKRLLDTRGAPPPAAGSTLVLSVANATGANGLPITNLTTAVILNVTATAATGGGFLAVWPDGTPRPLVSNVNYATGQTTSNLVIAPISPGGNIDIYVGGAATHVVVDIFGSYTSN